MVYTLSLFERERLSVFERILPLPSSPSPSLSLSLSFSLSLSLPLPLPLPLPPSPSLSLSRRLTHSRAWPSACVFRDQIYVTGGYDGQHRLRTVERFDSKEKKWTQIADMNEFRAGCGSAVL